MNENFIKTVGKNISITIIEKKTSYSSVEPLVSDTQNVNLVLTDVVMLLELRQYCISGYNLHENAIHEN